LSSSDLTTQVGLTGLAELTFLTFWSVKKDNVVSYLDISNTFTDGFNNTGTFVTKDNREDTL
jgi:hypothetical protein